MCPRSDPRKTGLTVFAFQGNMVKLPEEENTPDKRVNKIFDVMDKVKENYLKVENVRHDQGSSVNVIKHLRCQQKIISHQVRKSTTFQNF